MPLINATTAGPIRTLTLSAPPANTYSYEMMRELDAAILDARMDDDVHAIVLTGAGEKFFCAGADITMLQGAQPRFKYNFCLHANETLNRLEQTAKLVVAALNGHCVGGGLEVALACDFRVARAGGHKVGLPEVKLGVLPGTGGTARLSRLVGKGKAMELLLEGTNLDVAAAHALGIVNRVLDVGPEAFLAAVHDWVLQFCPPKAAALSVGLMKRSVQSGLEMGLHEHLAFERELQQRLFTSIDAKAGITAYVNKTAAKFEGG